MTADMPDGDRRSVSLTVNGAPVSAEVESRLLLLDFLRDHLRLGGTHAGCEHGVCGACTVLLDGQAVRSCLMFAVQAEGHEVGTIEGIANADGSLHPIQEAFSEFHGLQCGFCTPGMILATAMLLRSNAAPTDAEIREALAGNVCRCTGYVGIVRAVRAAGERMRP
jgi:aerobic carbon-monoxide dehydrogenase small subunit